MELAGDQASSSGVPASTSSPPASSTCGSSSSNVGVGLEGGESMLVPVVLDDLTFDNRQVRARSDL